MYTYPTGMSIEDVPSRNSMRVIKKSVIPQFPNFKKITLDDRKVIEEHHKKYPPYSDFNFVSMWCYNTEGKMLISYLNDNLIVKFQDYITSKSFYSFHGTNQITNTISALLRSGSSKTKPKLKLIPQSSVPNGILSDNLIVEEDLDNHDYILSIRQLKFLKGKKYRGKKNFVNRFTRKYSFKEVNMDLNDKSVQKDINNLFHLWRGNSNLSLDDVKNELVAVNRIFELSNDHKSLHAIGIYVDNSLIGFTINEVVHDKFAILHFEKADIAYEGIYAYLMFATANHLAQFGCKYINYEQDLGIPGLRKAKRSFFPTSMLKKYIIYNKGN